MTDIETLAQTIRTAHDIDTHEAACDVVSGHVNQISDDPELWDPDTLTLTPAGVAVVATAIAQAYAHGYHSTESQRLLDEIGEEAAAIKKLDDEKAERTEHRDKLIRTALRTELPRALIAQAAGIKESRLYQIRDQRR